MERSWRAANSDEAGIFSCLKERLLFICLVLLVSGCGSIEGGIKSLKGVVPEAEEDRLVLNPFPESGTISYLNLTSYALGWNLAQGTATSYALKLYEGSSCSGTIAQSMTTNNCFAATHLRHQRGASLVDEKSI